MVMLLSVDTMPLARIFMTDGYVEVTSNSTITKERVWNGSSCKLSGVIRGRMVFGGVSARKHISLAQEGMT